MVFLWYSNWSSEWVSALDKGKFGSATERMPNLPLSSPDTHSEDQLEYHKNTIFNNFNRFIDITNKTGFITLKLNLYKTMNICQFHY